MRANRIVFTLGAIASFVGVWASQSARANPNVQAAQVSVQQGRIQLSISGSQFGNQGPNVVVADSFENLQESSSQWDGGTPILEPEARTGNSSHLGFRTGEGRAKILRKELGGNYDDIYVSYWVKLGTDFFPGSSVNTRTAPRTFPDNSSWKFLWLMDGPEGYRGNNDFDLCIPTHTGRGSIQLAGNDGNFEFVDNNWWSWTSWVRISALIQDKPGDYGFFQTTSSEHGNEIQSFGNDSPFDRGVTDTFSYITMPGWMRGSNEQVVVYYDDVYIAVGEGAAARIEITDSANYNDSRVIDIAEPTSWNDGRISAVLATSSGLATSGNGYLFVFDSSGQRNSVGFPLCAECPKIPEPF